MTRNQCVSRTNKDLVLVVMKKVIKMRRKHGFVAVVMVVIDFSFVDSPICNMHHA
jgi:hypothetical protein